MSTVDRSPIEAEPPEDGVVEFLRDNPDFFLRHPELLESIEVPHEAHGAVSLIEHQVGVLRERCRDLRARLDELVANARRNEELGQRLHRLTLALVDCRRADEVFTTVYQALAEEFRSDFAAIRLFADPLHGDDRGLAEFVGADRPGPDLFESLARHAKPMCGRPQSAQAGFLFPDHASEVGSAALLPLGSAHWFGVLAIASRDAARFRRGMGTVFLRQLAEILTRVLGPHVREAG